jgi:adenylate kinase
MKPSLIVLGAPGSGKGTQAEKVSKEFGYLHLSTGDILRSEIEKKSVIGLKVQDIMAKGDLVSDELVLDLLKERFKNKEKSYLLDGFPRNLTQADMLSKQLVDLGCEYKVIYFNVDLGLIKERIVNRRTCKKCGEIYNLITKPLAVNGTCKKCGPLGEIVHRKDDTEEVVDNRLKVFKEMTDPIVHYYKSKGVLIELDAQQEESKVFENLKKIINSL